MNNKLLLWAITSALAGFIFGFDLIVISGAEKTIQGLWSLSSEQHGLAISAALWGTVLGSIFGGIPTNRFGRKKTLLAIGILYLVSSLGSAFATGFGPFCLARFIGGVGVGIATVAAPLFISEISPAERRGRLTGMFQFNIVLGILIAFLSNAIISSTMGDSAWRWMLGVEAIPALIYSLMCFTLPESPRWLIAKGRFAEGKAVLARVNPELSEESLKALTQEISTASDYQQPKAPLAWSRLRTPLTIAFLVAFFNQLSGINAIITFAPRIFQMTGLGEQAAILQSAGIGVMNFTFTLLGLRLIDRLGRRKLLYLGSFGYIASLALCAIVFATYATSFKVGSAAIQVREFSEKSQRPDLTKSDLETATLDLRTSTAALENASADPGYGGPLVRVPESASAAELSALSEQAVRDAGEQSGGGGLLVMVCIFAFIAAHAIGQGTVIWVLISEVFPARARAFGQSFGSATHWVFAALLTLVFPLAMETFSPASIFGFFCFMMILQLLWVRFMVPETKGVSLENMEETLAKR